MPITIDEEYINRVRGIMRAAQLSVRDILGGGTNGLPLNDLVITPSSGNWSTGARFTATTRTTGNNIDTRLVSFAGDLDRNEGALGLFLEETDRVESLNSEDAVTFAARFGAPSATPPST